ncbi:MAG: hypothetical protein BWZ00_00467 [Bacteroidetes bacterium ADurb.BinA174]|nr:MAG: hypothetical protein BWZ00_00467 [Bacteroidetes bacterium ADurb.BinA174]
MQVITIESEAFQTLMKKIKDIEQYVRRTSDLFSELENTLELTSREVMDTLGISKSTLYRWRESHTVPFRYDERGNALYPYKDLVVAVKNGTLTMQNANKSQILAKLSDFKESIITNSLWQNSSCNDTL